MPNWVSIYYVQLTNKSELAHIKCDRLSTCQSVLVKMILIFHHNMRNAQSECSPYGESPATETIHIAKCDSHTRSIENIDHTSQDETVLVTLSQSLK